jgi:hypothetical protein
MLLKKGLGERAFQPEHIQEVLAEIRANFPKYLDSFEARNNKTLEKAFQEAISAYEKEQIRYQKYMDNGALEAFEDAPVAFKKYTRTDCPIIHGCLNAKSEIMDSYRRSFNMAEGWQILSAVKNIAYFALDYVADFDDSAHESAQSPVSLSLESLQEDKYYCVGVIGYGIQSSLLYGLHARHFAHRSQRAVWALLFLSGRKRFGYEEDEGSEFLMVRPEYGNCEQNYFYPPQLFGFYALQVFLMLKNACKEKNITFYDRHRYIYLDVFMNHVADTHQEDIDIFKWSSDHVENNWWH